MPPFRLSRKLFLRLVLAVIALGLLGSVLWQIDWTAFQQFASRLTALAILGAFLTYGAQNVFRALRYRALLGDPTLPLRSLIPISLYHNGMVRLLPFKLGEATYVILMRQHHQVSVQAGVSTLFLARLLELFIILAVGVITVVAFGGIVGSSSVGMLALLLGGGLLLGAVMLSGRGLHWLLHVMEQRWPALTARTGALHHLADELDALRQPQRFLGGLFWSLFTYGSTFLTSAILLNALGVALSPDRFVIVISLGMFASAFPFNISGFGLVEWSLALGLVQFAGLPLGEATAMGLLLNGFQQLAALVWGIIGFALLSWVHRDAAVR